MVLRYDGTTGAFLSTLVTPDSGGLRCPLSMSFTETDPTTLNYDGGSPSPSPATAITASVGPSADTLIAIGPVPDVTTSSDLAPPPLGAVSARGLIAHDGHRLHPSDRPAATTVLPARNRAIDITPTDLRVIYITRTDDGAHHGERTPIDDLIRHAPD